MTSTTWTQPPTMPANLPPLPMGRNGKPLVYLGTGPLSIPSQDRKYYSDAQGGWHDDYDGTGEWDYAAESDSEICRLNQWGDFTPAQPSEPCKDAQPPTLAAYLASIELYIKEADEAMQKATELAAAWAEELAVRRRIRNALEGGAALTRREWYMAGRKDERHHAKVRTIFPLHP